MAAGELCGTAQCQPVAAGRPGVITSGPAIATGEPQHGPRPHSVRHGALDTLDAHRLLACRAASRGRNDRAPRADRGVRVSNEHRRVSADVGEAFSSVVAGRLTGMYENSETHRAGAGIDPPRLRHEVKPAYTTAARRQGIEGDVLVEIVVRRDGTVGDVRLMRRLGHGLDEQAIAAVRQWRFDPARRHGAPVDVIVEVSLQFRLR